MNENVRLTADAVVFGKQDGRLHLLLIQRAYDPYAGKWALPGGHIDAGEYPFDAATRELMEETGLVLSESADGPGVPLDAFGDATEPGVLVGVFGNPNRDPRGRYVTWAFMGVLDHLPEPTAADDARAARWVPLADVIADFGSLAFDHARIITAALSRLGIAVVDGGRTLKDASRLAVGDVVSRDSHTWWRLNQYRDTDSSGLVWFDATCTAIGTDRVDGPWIGVGDTRLFGAPRDCWLPVKP